MNGTAVVAENVDVERFTDRSSLLRASLGEAETRDVAEKNAVVSVSFRSATPDAEWPIATEDGEWRLVWF